VFDGETKIGFFLPAAEKSDPKKIVIGLLSYLLLHLSSA
jgi:hypothetical protein